MSKYPTSGDYAIVPVIGIGSASVNGSLKIATQFVRLGLQDYVWELTERAEGLYKFAVKGVYPYVGVEGNRVIATIEVGKDSLWHTTYRESDHAFTIEPDHDHGTAWTVSEKTEPDAFIVIDKIEYLPPKIEPPFVKPTQLFRFVKVQ